MAIISLLIGMVALNWPQPKPPITQQMQEFSFQANAFIQDGVISGDSRAIGFGQDGYGLYQFEDEAWQPVIASDWQQSYKLTMMQDGEKVKLPKTPLPMIVFEPTGAAQNFTLDITNGRLSYRVSTTPNGQVSVDAR